MKYYFEDWRGKNTITLKRASAEWVNSDCPDILTEEGETILHNGGLNGWYGLPFENENLLKQLRRFVITSDKAFCKKYAHLGFTFEDEGKLVKNLDREIENI